MIVFFSFLLLLNFWFYLSTIFSVCMCVCVCGAFTKELGSKLKNVWNIFEGSDSVLSYHCPNHLDNVWNLSQQRQWAIFVEAPKEKEQEWSPQFFFLFLFCCLEFILLFLRENMAGKHDVNDLTFWCVQELKCSRTKQVTFTLLECVVCSSVLEISQV